MRTTNHTSSTSPQQHHRTGTQCWANDPTLQLVAEQHRHWDRVFHEMHLLAADEHLGGGWPCRPRILLIGDASICQDLILGLSGKAPAPFPDFEVIHLRGSEPDCENILGDEGFVCAQSQGTLLAPQSSGDLLATLVHPFPKGLYTDMYIVRDISTLSADASDLLRRLYGRSQILITLNLAPDALADILDDAKNSEQPVLSLVLQSAASINQSVTTSWALQTIKVTQLSAIVDYLRQLPELWPCLLAQDLDQHVRYLRKRIVPRLSRWRFFWFLAVSGLDLGIFYLAFQWIQQMGWLQALLNLDWTALPSLLAMGTFFSLTIITTVSFFLLWRIHQGTCALCAVSFGLCFGGTPTRERFLLRQALRANSRHYLRSMARWYPIGWSNQDSLAADAFCQYCQNLKKSISANPQS